MKKHIASFSGGKDSAATVILAHEHGDPLDTIIFFRKSCLTKK